MQPVLSLATVSHMCVHNNNVDTSGWKAALGAVLSNLVPSCAPRMDASSYVCIEANDQGWWVTGKGRNTK